MSAKTTRRGPLGHRLLILIFAFGVALLAFWLLGYVMSDVDQMRGPDYKALVEDRLPQELLDQKQSLADQLVVNRARVAEVTEQRKVIQKTIDNSQQTIDQLVELKKLTLKNDTELSDQEQSAMTDNLKAFLDRQRTSQELSEELVTLNLQSQKLAAEMRTIDGRLESAREPLKESYDDEYGRHQWKLASIKLLILLPLLMIGGVLFWRSSGGGTYAPLVYAFSAALICRVLLVMHDHFPAIVFRYLLIVTSLLVATGILFKLLRSIKNPSQAWLLKQYREAYANFYCPKCEYPIRRGPMKFTAWTRRTLHKTVHRISAQDAIDGDVPYTCPCCATTLFETCVACDQTRPSLLPACDKCGSETESPAIA